jgi:hypothetical protein
MELSVDDVSALLSMIMKCFIAALPDGEGVILESPNYQSEMADFLLGNVRPSLRVGSVVADEPPLDTDETTKQIEPSYH